MNNREKILKAAEKLFSAQGFHDTSLRSIAREAGVGVSSVMYYFGDKASLYRALFSGNPEEEISSRERILNSAEHLFAERGYNGVSIRDISTKAEVNSALISYYFGGKSGLYKDVLKKGDEVVAAYIKEQALPTLSAEEKIFSFGEYFKYMSVYRPTILRIFYWEQVYPTDIFMESGKRWMTWIHDFLAGAIEQGKAEGKFRQDINSSEAAIAWGGMVMSYFNIGELRHKAYTNTQITAEGYLKDAFHIFIKGIRKE
jgi:TetR/AcrR family transcriptional regulator